MKFLALIPALALAATSAWAAKDCEELKSEIAAKLEAKGVAGYVLEIVANAEVGDRTVVGSCDAGTRKILYRRGGPG